MLIKGIATKQKAQSLRCETCGAVLMNSPSGTICPDSITHGKLGPKVAEQELVKLRQLDWMASLPTAIPYDSTILGKPMILYRVGNIGCLRIESKVYYSDVLRHPGCIYARHGNYAYEFGRVRGAIE